ncbi:Protein of unknown function [Pyronema omphalodes CBS 100304]|uniref:Uncharacterized protein n=1 Tax=Pyronema omphalodes (strain CBS 100304) TaxID=1076935 RepID=U4LUV6_PYROM|nr:Protein of unknown function [Pyronema omphalodes CBS 100304]
MLVPPSRVRSSKFEIFELIFGPRNVHHTSDCVSFPCRPYAVILAVTNAEHRRSTLSLTLTAIAERLYMIQGLFGRRTGESRQCELKPNCACFNAGRAGYCKFPMVEAHEAPELSTPVDRRVGVKVLNTPHSDLVTSHKTDNEYRYRC